LGPQRSDLQAEQGARIRRGLPFVRQIAVTRLWQSFTLRITAAIRLKITKHHDSVNFNSGCKKRPKAAVITASPSAIKKPQPVTIHPSHNHLITYKNTYPYQRSMKINNRASKQRRHSKRHHAKSEPFGSKSTPFDQKVSRALLPKQA